MPKSAKPHEIKVAVRIHAHAQGVEQNRQVVARYALHLALLEHRHPQIGLHVLPVDFRRIDARDIGEGGKQLERAVVDRRAEGHALELPGLHDPGRLGRRDDERRLVVDHVDRDRLLALVLRGKPRDRVDVAESRVVGGTRHLGHRGARPRPLVELDIDAGLLEIPLVVGQEEPRLRALKLPVEDEANLERIRCLRGPREPACQRAGHREAEQRGNPAPRNMRSHGPSPFRLVVFGPAEPPNLRRFRNGRIHYPHEPREPPSDFSSNIRPVAAGPPSPRPSPRGGEGESRRRPPFLTFSPPACGRGRGRAVRPGGTGVPPVVTPDLFRGPACQAPL